ncbi:MAG: indole-3-glycerol phosphate synthase TrpC [Actinobacteria bacterium]|nr:indole-3-glycerol phosphate synthase TrpC [Actinomycetota bacterium]
MRMFLDEVAELTRKRVERDRALVPSDVLWEECAHRRQLPSFRDALLRLPGGSINVIAEVKRSSPSRGPIRPDLVLEDLLGCYERGGACAISVLTEPEFFGGSLDDIYRACSATALPVLRKDFILDPYQLLEARAAGAGAVLLIAHILEDGELIRLLSEAEGLGLEALVEVHDEDELEAALDAGASIIGINNRDLKTLEVDLETTTRLAALVPETKVLVSESGYTQAGEMADLADLGVDAVLVGEFLVKQDDPERAVRELIGGGDSVA